MIVLVIVQERVYHGREAMATEEQHGPWQQELEEHLPMLQLSRLEPALDRPPSPGPTTSETSASSPPGDQISKQMRPKNHSSGEGE